jgi:hypothetical protein
VTTPGSFDDCNFDDDGFCNWQIDTPDKPWIISTGEKAVFGQAPLSDHTKKNVYGKYAYVPIDGAGGPIYYATLGIRSLPKNQALCLDFWYQVYISSDTTLNVYVQNGTSAAALNWRRPGTTARDQWTHATVNVVTSRTTTRLTISGMHTLSTVFIYLLISSILFVVSSGRRATFSRLRCHR